jgi:putative transcriptional regulator
MLRGAALVSVLLLCSVALPQTPVYPHRVPDAGEKRLSSGDLVVASEKLGDPNFAESVVLILEHDEDKGTVGVIINRRSELPLSRVFPDIKGASADPVYVGGPVSLTAVQALLRSPEKSDDVRQVSGDIYATGSKEIIEKSVRSRIASSKFRLYVGYAGWAPGQLEMEIKIGAWIVLSNRSKLSFDEDPDSLWSRLNRESQMQIAAAKPQPGRSGLKEN